MMNIKRKYRVFFILMVLVWMLSFVSHPSMVQSQSHNEISKLITNSSGIKFDVSVPWEELKITDLTVDGEDYVQLSLPGWSDIPQESAPSLPSISKAFGVPLGASISISAIPGRLHKILLETPVLPSPKQIVNREAAGDQEGKENALETQTVVEKDTEIYSADAVYPGPFAEIMSDGFVRQQRVVSLELYPIQYNPTTSELYIYESLQVELTFEGGINSYTVHPADSAFFEAWFQNNLENYESAKAWRVSKDTLTQPTQIETNTREGSGSPWMPPDPGWRIKLQNQGMYRITYSELQNAGFPITSVDPQTIKMYNQGEERAIMITGNGDDIFDTDETIVFYGEAIQSKYTGENAYWLTHGGENGLRFDPRSAAPGAGTAPASIDAIDSFEENKIYLSKIAGEDDFERYIWDRVVTISASGSVTLSFHLEAPIIDTEANLKLWLHGYLSRTQNPDHHASVSLNGSNLGDATWDGFTSQLFDVTIPANVLVAGDNSLTVTGLNDLGVGLVYILIDRFEISYQSAFQAYENTLTFAENTPGTWQFQIGGFSSDQITAFDVTDPHAVVPLADVAVTGGSAPYTLAFEETLDAPQTYWTGTLDSYRSVSEITRDTPSNWQAKSNAADYILIAHETFMKAGADLKDFRAKQGYRSVLVDVQDIYDEFNFGITDANGIHDFLLHTFANWEAPAPTFVVLMGDGHYDPKDYENYGRTSFIPPYLAVVDPWIYETAADNRFVTLIGEDTMPDMMIGRLSVEDEPSAAILVNKIIQYEENADILKWKRSILAVADNADSGGNFPVLSDQLINEYVPEYYLVEKVYLGITHTSIPQAKTAFQTAVNNGVLFVNFIGHGEYNSWTDEQLFTIDDVPNLSNPDRFPVVLSMTCLDGSFHRPGTTWGDYRALAEVITRAEDKGAVASWSPTGLGLASGHDRLNAGFYDAVFTDGVNTLGEAVLAGKLKLWNSGYNLDLLETYTLFGDPAMKIWVSGNTYYFMPLITH